ncbi:DUF2461 domain-containing protein [Nocardioides sp. GY 10113]|uniref:DUF2461 domain-containing protein n=1 Tax=Nocardioides sp. GY 10113 TaxID=2569761 RepID=UPI0010A917EE|nr:DUF2461 domain-containing protein [Nocardioides sp. GY 10113]TIC83619.1 DUF2461 domain-containing protein [Nocardioides sp. GY 10113]
MSFEGFPVAALDFYDDLEVDNTRSWWDANKHIYQDAVLAPMQALTAALADEFGPAKIFRPYRDVRFSKEKTPYKTHQGAFVAIAPETGYYVEVSPRGIRTGGGCYWFAPPRLAAFRAAVDNAILGADLEKRLAKATRMGYEVGGDTLKTKPRGYDAEHPRIALLRHKSLTLGRHIGFEPVIHTPGLIEEVRRDWRAIRPVTEWLAEYAEARPE